MKFLGKIDDWEVWEFRGALSYYPNTRLDGYLIKGDTSIQFTYSGLNGYFYGGDVPFEVQPRLRKLLWEKSYSEYIDIIDYEKGKTWSSMEWEWKPEYRRPAVGARMRI